MRFHAIRRHSPNSIPNPESRIAESRVPNGAILVDSSGHVESACESPRPRCCHFLFRIGYWSARDRELETPARRAGARHRPAPTAPRRDVHRGAACTARRRRPAAPSARRAPARPSRHRPPEPAPRPRRVPSSARCESRPMCPGAQVFIDRQFVGTTPLTAENVKPGTAPGERDGRRVRRHRADDRRRAGPSRSLVPLSRGSSRRGPRRGAQTSHRLVPGASLSRPSTAFGTRPRTKTTGSTLRSTTSNRFRWTTRTRICESSCGRAGSSTSPIPTATRIACSSFIGTWKRRGRDWRSDDTSECDVAAREASLGQTIRHRERATSLEADRIPPADSRTARAPGAHWHRMRNFSVRPASTEYYWAKRSRGSTSVK